MTKKRLSPNQLAEVKANFAGLKQIGGYSPLNAEYKVSAIESIETALEALLVQEAQFGDDSAEYQSLGRKRASDRAKGRPKTGGVKSNG